MGTQEPFLPQNLALRVPDPKEKKMSDLLEDGSFMFTSESVGEGHPGESSVNFRYLNLKLSV